MKFQLDFDIPALEKKIEHPSNIFLIGSCFAENITTYLHDLKYNVLSNPHGILYNAQSISNSILRIIRKHTYTPLDLVERDGLFHCFDFHSSFSGMDQALVLDNMNRSIEDAYLFLETAEYVIITLGTSFAYKHLERDLYVGNNHKMPAANFRKELLDATSNERCLSEIIHAVKSINPSVKFIFTVSPVRHIRDGLVENSLSKANLLSAVHELKEDGYYFPAYELVVDVLRDYRFFKRDLVHPSKQAVEFVWEAFVSNCLSSKDEILRKKIIQLNNNLAHRPLHKESNSYKEFVISIKLQEEELKKQYPYLKLD